METLKFLKNIDLFHRDSSGNGAIFLPKISHQQLNITSIHE